MALRLVRETSDTPNITNKDDTIMTRYAYGGYNGVVKNFGSECSYTAENGVFKILDGRIIIDGWEIDVDGAGVLLDFSTLIGVQYCSIYLEINISIESVKIASVNQIGSYPVIEKGDDLTETPNGTARLLLYNVTVRNGVVSDVTARFEIIPYLFEKILDVENSYLRLTTNLENGLIKPKTSKYAIYASEDESKGTIEDRLTALGFKEGSVALSSGTATVNKVTRQGNYVIGKVEFEEQLTVNLGTSNNDGSFVLGTLPEQFRPKEEVLCGVTHRGSASGNSYVEWLPASSAKISTNGTITVYYKKGSSGYSNYQAALSGVVLGFEAKGISSGGSGGSGGVTPSPPSSDVIPEEK